MTYVDLLPLVDVAHEPGQPEQADERQELGEPEYPQRPAGLQDLEALAEILHPQKLRHARGALRQTGVAPITFIIKREKNEKKKTNRINAKLRLPQRTRCSIRRGQLTHYRHLKTNLVRRDASKD